MDKETKTRNSTSGHRHRLRQKFMETGFDGFHDYEVIELLLTLNTPRKDCKASAKELLRRFKTLPGVFEASAGELEQVHGIGPANVFGLKLIREVSCRYLEKRVVGKQVVKNSRDLEAYLVHALAGKAREMFVGIFLDAKNRVIACDTLFTGTLNASAVYPREVIARAIEYRAAGVIFAHNHPSGDAAPSPADMAITRRLVFALGHAGIRVHEHLITASEGRYSFADQGVIAQWHEEFDRNNG
ncbi:MAG: DNA repair protein RadC [Desulfobacteraceae bacterium]